MKPHVTPPSPTSRMVVVVLDATLGDSTGPRTPIGGVRRGPGGTYAKGDSPFGGRCGPGGPPSYYWRAADGTGGWVDGVPPARCGKWYEP